MPRWFAAMFLIAPMALAAGGAVGQSYPVKSIRMVTSEPGSGTDFLARLLAQAIAGSLGKQVVVDNKGGGILAIDFVFRAPPDGYTLLLYGTSLWLAPLMRDNLPYDPVRDFAPITLATSSPNILAVYPALTVETVKDLVALARAKPGELNYGSGSTGAPTHLAAELFKTMTGVKIVRIPYKGTGPAINALIGGQVHLMFVSSSSVMLHVTSGKLKALAVTTLRPTTLAPGLPTVAATGVPGYEATSQFGVFAPAAFAVQAKVLRAIGDAGGFGARAPRKQGGRRQFAKFARLHRPPIIARTAAHPPEIA